MQGNEQIKMLYRATYIYLALPLFIFVASWLDYGIASIMCLLFITGFYYLYSNIKEEKLNLCLNKNEAISAFIIALIWCFCAGIGYFYYQSFDYHFRNAVFRDLINYPWPVFYDKADTPMVYYMGFWLVPAFLTKICALFGFSQNTLFLTGNILLLLYAALGTLLIFLHLFYALKTKNTKQMLVATLLFMFFSGADIIGYLFFKGGEQPFTYHLDWWAFSLQYSSFATGMFWVFNQFIPTALGTLLIYNEKNICHFGFLLPLVLFLAPYPALGLGILMFVFALVQLIQAKNKKKFIGDSFFSIDNIIGIFWLLPLVCLYFSTNSNGVGKLWYVFDYTTPLRLVLFMILEFLLFALILFKPYHKNTFFVTAVSLLIIIPFFRYDQQNNFCMRVSLPALIILAICTLEFVFTNFKKPQYKKRWLLLVILLVLGMPTAMMEFYRGWHTIAEIGKVKLVRDGLYTLNQRNVIMPEFGYRANHQFSAADYKNDIFWQYLAHRNIPDMR